MKDLFLDTETRSGLEWEEFLGLVEVQSSLGFDFKRHLAPFSADQRDAMKREWKRTVRFGEWLKKQKVWTMKLTTVLREVRDVHRSLERAREGMILTIAELYEIKRFLFACMQVRDLLKPLALRFLSRYRPHDTTPLHRFFCKGNQSPQTFAIVDAYSPCLAEIRRKKKKLLTQSETNQLTWKEKRLQLEQQEDDEEKRIRQTLSQSVAAESNLLLADTRRVANLDFLTGKSLLSLQYRGVSPELLSSRSRKAITIEDGVHWPMALRWKERGVRFQPITLEAGKGALLITGANMSGKTVLLKTIGLLVAMAQYGFLVPAHCMSFLPRQFLFFSTRGREPDGLSAYGIEIAGVKRVLRQDVSDGLLLFDELARGTNPQEGFAINAALLTYLQQKQAPAILTSHFDGLANLCNVDHWQMSGLGDITLDQVKALTKGIGEELIIKLMSYRLEQVERDRPIPRDALKIALMLGLNSDVIELAEKYLEQTLQ
jgi:dsDNA-specific endonuclease/ATPase MutS2